MNDNPVAEAQQIIEAVWQEMQRSPFVQRELGLAIDRFPEISECEAQRRATLGAEVLARCVALADAPLDDELRLTLDVARFKASAWACEADWYWLVFDPMGVGFYALFAPTAYAGGFLLNEVHAALKAVDVSGDEGRDRYLELLSGYAALVRQLRERTQGQAKRGIRIPQPQLTQSLELLTAFRKRASDELAPDLDSLPPEFRSAVERRIADEVAREYDSFIAALDSATYRDLAPAAVGIGQYPGGLEAYASLVRLHTTLDLTPQQVHDRGLRRMDEVARDMVALFEHIGFAGTAAEYLEALSRDPRWRASDTAALQAMFQRYIDRFDPLIDSCFDFRPAAGYDAAPLPEALEGSMSFGFYSSPNGEQDKGLYLFNSRNLTSGPLPNIAALNYHELVPGHHFHEASQRENTSLHPIRQHSFVNAFNEGWAEYAATLAGEVGMYREPEEQFGRLMMDAFLTCRLVVDTGMNAFGWSLEQAREYMRKHAFMPEQEIRTETIRYSCDIPGQSLAYKLGDEFILAERERMRAALGERFSLSAFHNAVLKPGALPLPVLADRLRAETARIGAA
jgi:uncharacterized protein (DUF885 family)